MIIENEKNLLDELRKHGKFLSTHGKIRKFSSVCILKSIQDFDYNIFSTITKRNLLKLQELLECEWEYCIQYTIKGSSNRKGHFVYGISKTQNLINFHRKELLKQGSGQTVFHIDNKDLQIHRILKNEIKLPEIHIVKKLLEVTNSLYLEKLFFQRM